VDVLWSCGYLYMSSHG